jgi:hypothetical protein
MQIYQDRCNSTPIAWEATDKDFEASDPDPDQLFCDADSRCRPTCSMEDHLAKGSATAEQIATLEGIDSATPEIIYQRKLVKQQISNREIVNEHVGFS